MRGLIAIAFFIFEMSAQNDVLTFDEYFRIVRENHPLIKTANLAESIAGAELMEARGSFDPKIEASADEKVFGGTNYFQHRSALFKVPTWYGVEFAAGIENNDGIYLNPENTVPDRGLASAGLKVPLGQDMLINRRMADLKAAKLALSMARSERKLRAAEALKEAANAYFNWKRQFEEAALYKRFYEVARQRKAGVIRSFELGEKPAIDSVEAGIAEKSRLLALEDANLKLVKARLELSNFLWVDGIPLELSELAVPQSDLSEAVRRILKTDSITIADNHPKLRFMRDKVSVLEIERRLKANALLPKLDIGYSWLSQPMEPGGISNENYKVTANFSVPLFLRKERGALKLAKLKVIDAELSLLLQKLELQNNIQAYRRELGSLERQRQIAASVVAGHDRMVISEERIFEMGESSLFIINSREASLISARLTEIEIENRLLVAHGNLFGLVANID